MGRRPPDRVALRYSYLDLQDRAVDGGRRKILMPGLNWCWSEQIRWQFNYGFAHIEIGSSPGNLDIFQLRLEMGF
jgi:phosphate-selective porin